LDPGSTPGSSTFARRSLGVGELRAPALWLQRQRADAIFNKIDGDIRIKDDTILVTCYDAPKDMTLDNYYQGLPEKLIKEGVNPRIPWLYFF
jgi:hypothetical protein